MGVMNDSAVVYGINRAIDTINSGQQILGNFAVYVARVVAVFDVWVGCSSRSLDGKRLSLSIAQLGARTPAMLAMSAMSMQLLSGGRFVLGLGTSGPKGMEGWHGVRFAAPVAMTRETIEIVRTVTRGDRLVHEGKIGRAHV